MGTRPLLYTTYPDLVREVLIERCDIFPDRHGAFKSPVLTTPDNSLLRLRGERWKHVRRVLSPTFTTWRAWLLLAAQRADSSNQALTEEELLSNAYVFIGAGYETTSTALAFTSHLLARHQAVQSRLYDEIAANVPASGDLDYEAVLGLPYLEMVIQESLRLYPPVEKFGRQSNATTEVQGVRIPRGTFLAVVPLRMHYDPDLWPDPERFDPERFSAENKPRIVPCSYMPFGSGPRHCIGKRFALMEIKLALCHVLRRYRLLPTSEPLELAVVPPSLAPASGQINLRVELRRCYSDGAAGGV
ncbi:cytochrome P450 3A19-like [Pollicipes pollicipes]|uniref:cytochrome P450 3A19-like n=1 Tax=Pollicipes pollicipes TaxID=41117 RepID=UPI0018859EB5|nr:cytochrome P450 3A19-like [Pollicipes pollicipes]